MSLPDPWKVRRKDPLQEAFDFYAAGRMDQAIQAYQAILSRDPNNGEANHLLGVIAFRQGHTETARDYMVRAIDSPRATAEMHNNLGSVFTALREEDEAVKSLERAIAMRPDYVDALNNLGVLFRNAKKIERAIEVFARALKIDPNNAHVKVNLRAAYRDVVPAWHFAMMDDKPRNDAYEAAIRRAAPGKRVLDIGTGAGLLTMMAARAGAARVTGCEAVAVIAERAQAIVERNGFGARATVFAKRSQDLMVGRDLPERANLLVTETFSSGLINEDVLPTIEHAHEHLLTPDAAVIPAAASAMGYLVGGDILKGFLFVGSVNGFDLTPFDDFAPPNMQLSLDRLEHDIYSDDVELIRFNLKDRNFAMDSRRVRVKVTRPGVCLGVAQWIMLELDSVTHYDNRPTPNAPPNGHWSHVVYRFPKPLPVQAGDSIELLVKSYRTQITVELAEQASP